MRGRMKTLIEEILIQKSITKNIKSYLMLDYNETFATSITTEYN